MDNKQIEHASFYDEIRAILQQAHSKAYLAVHSAMVEAYWNIGRRIVEEEQKGEKRAEYGSGLLKKLSVQLAADFGKGFSYANLRNFRQFYLTYPDKNICYTLCSKLSWSHNRLIMRVENKEAREYYLLQSKAQRWSVRPLERNIKSLYYERLLSTSDKKQLPTTLHSGDDTIQDFIKDPYVLEFLKLAESAKFKESELEAGIIDNLQAFLLEFGKGFSFVGRQFRISSETSHFYIDLVFYNYLLKCFVLLDLKTGKLTQQDIGQMDMYVRIFDDLKRSKNDNPSIGLILCRDKDETIAKYSVLKGSEQLFASRYRLVLPAEEELQAEVERGIWLIENKT